MPWPGTGEPIVDAVVGVCVLPGGPGPNKVGDSPSPDVEPGTAKPEVGGVRPERGAGATGE